MSDTDVLETLEPSVPVYKVVLAEGTDYEVTLQQRPLSFFGKIELFSVLGEAIEKALSEGATLSELLDVPENTGLDTDSLREADVFIKAIARVVRFVPDLLEDIYCISLSVKRSDREYVKELLREESDEKMMAVANQFVDQNWDAIMDFFSEQVKPMIAKVSSKLESRSTSSKPSKATRARTPKQ